MLVSDKEKTKECFMFVYSDVVPYFWEFAGDGTFAEGVQKYLVDVAEVSQDVIDDFRDLMLE